MSIRVRARLMWLARRPIALLNVLFVVLVVGMFVWLMVRPINVLSGWHIHTTATLYHPNDVLQFTSTSTKLMSAQGVTSRIFVCDATGTAAAREIQLDKIPANKAPGYNPSRENAIQVPDVVQFNGLPRTCRLVISTCYENVILWRDECESATSNDFKVTNDNPTIDQLNAQIQALQRQIDTLKAQLSSRESAHPYSSSPAPAEKTPQSNSQASPEPVEPKQCTINLLGLCI